MCKKAVRHTHFYYPHFLIGGKLTTSVNVMHLLHYGAGQTPGLCDIKAMLRPSGCTSADSMKTRVCPGWVSSDGPLPALRFVSQWGLQECLWEKVIIFKVCSSLCFPLWLLPSHWSSHMLATSCRNTSGLENSIEKGHQQPISKASCGLKP